jgi:N-acyl-D-aspartate/D-glutamate deacylase
MALGGKQADRSDWLTDLTASWRSCSDLPAGGKRLLQKVHGYDATIVSGHVTFREGEPTGTLPGKLVRAPQQTQRRKTVLAKRGRAVARRGRASR